MSLLAILPSEHYSENRPSLILYWSHVGQGSRGDWDDCWEQRILSQLSDSTKMCSLLWQDLWRECESRPLNPHPRLTAGGHTKLLVWKIMLSFLAVFFQLQLIIWYIGWSWPELFFCLSSVSPGLFLSANLPLPLIAAYNAILFQMEPDNTLFSAVWLRDIYVCVYSSRVLQRPHCIVQFVLRSHFPWVREVAPVLIVLQCEGTNCSRGSEIRRGCILYRPKSHCL